MEYVGQQALGSPPDQQHRRAPRGEPLGRGEVRLGRPCEQLAHRRAKERSGQLVRGQRGEPRHAVWPERDLAIARSLRNPKSNLGGRILQFASVLAERFDRIFP